MCPLRWKYWIDKNIIWDYYRIYRNRWNGREMEESGEMIEFAEIGMQLIRMA